MILRPVSRRLPSRRTAQQGVVLIESMVAMLIFVIGILGIVGLQAVMVRNTTDAGYRVTASAIAQKRLSDIALTDVANRGSLSEIQTDISATSGLPGGQRTTKRGDPTPSSGCNGDDDCYIVIVYWTAPGDTVQHNYTIVTRID